MDAIDFSGGIWGGAILSRYITEPRNIADWSGDLSGVGNGYLRKEVRAGDAKLPAKVF